MIKTPSGSEIEFPVHLLNSENENGRVLRDKQLLEGIQVTLPAASLAPHAHGSST